MNTGLSMKVINLEQGTSDWLAWRQAHITGSDASIIMGNNPWENKRDLWKRKLGLLDPVKDNDLMRRGRELEPIARKEFEALTEIKMKPVTVEHKIDSWLGASLDGMNEFYTKALEIKCGGETLHNLAKAMVIPPYYKDQIQHILMVTELEWMYYFSYRGEGVLIEVEADNIYQERLYEEEYKFYKSMINFEMPEEQ